MIFELVKKNQKELLQYTKKKLKKLGYKNILATKDYIFALGDIPVMMVAHLDTVHDNVPQTVLYDKEQKLIWSPERNWWR